MRISWGFATLLSAILTIQGVVAFNGNAPADVPTWCGKPYMSSNHSLNPGGQFQFPKAQQAPLLYLTIQPQYSIFLESDKSGSFIVNAPISHYFGQSYKNASYDTTGSSQPNPFVTLDLEIFDEESGALLVSSSVPVGSSGNLLGFSFAKFRARYAPYQISIYGTSPDGQQAYQASTQIYVLPARTYGSAVKIDNLYGGLYVQNSLNNWEGWYAVFPNGYYADGSFVTPTNFSMANLDTYASQGFTTINVVPGGPTFPVDSFSPYWDRMDVLNLFNIYDMRGSYQNASLVTQQVETWKNRTTLLSWYTADEPDGWSYNLNSTKLTYDLLKELDPYHPVTLVLNCQNYHYAEYTAGADIVFEDAYPVAINATYSIPWSTPCNETYGDCGCDNCLGELIDVSTRLDTIQSYQANLPNQGSKPTWPVIQTFGEQDYWKSIPSPAEVENMMMLAINHDAKGLTYWLYPSTGENNVGSGQLGKVFGSEPARGFIFGANAIKGLVVSGEGLVDASAWVVGTQMMVGVAGGEYVDSGTVVSITLPRSVKSVASVLYGDGSWTMKGNKLMKKGLKGLEVGLVVLDLA